jgi:hypothetical protein
MRIRVREVRLSKIRFTTVAVLAVSDDASASTIASATYYLCVCNNRVTAKSGRAEQPGVPIEAGCGCGCR